VCRRPAVGPGAVRPVLNAARRLAVFPKSFHGPLVDYAEDAQPYRSVERELEEELFGREDVDSVIGDSRQADPMHRSRLSAPMGRLADHLDDDSWRIECTGFGFNLLTGNYEFASLIVVHDDSWWTTYGGHIEANWESTGLRRYSTLDRDALTALAAPSPCPLGAQPVGRTGPLQKYTQPALLPSVQSGRTSLQRMTPGPEEEPMTATTVRLAGGDIHRPDSAR
jgi:hypothetical protein